MNATSVQPTAPTVAVMNAVFNAVFNAVLNNGLQHGFPNVRARSTTPAVKQAGGSVSYSFACSARARLRLMAAVIVLAAPMIGCTELSIGTVRATPLSRFVQLSGAYQAVSYRVVVGDQLTIRCYYNPQLDEDVTVRPDGNISLSLVGEIRGAGRTAADLSADITKAYSQYFVKSTAVVIVRQFTGNRVFTAGELKLPGLVNLLTGARTVLESIAASGGVTPDGTLTHVILIRRLPSQARPIVAELNLARALSGDDPSQDVQLMPNDFVYVPRSGAADFNYAMQQYVFKNLNMATNVGLSAGYNLNPTTVVK